MACNKMSQNASKFNGFLVTIQVLRHIFKFKPQVRLMLWES